jgi:hypothetical protein
VPDQAKTKNLRQRTRRAIEKSYLENVKGLFSGMRANSLDPKYTAEQIDKHFGDEVKRLLDLRNRLLAIVEELVPEEP